MTDPNEQHMKHFLVSDEANSIIRISYLCDNPNQIFITMVKDVLTSYAEQVGPKIALDSGFYPPDSIVDLDDYFEVAIQVFQRMAHEHNNNPWNLIAKEMLLWYWDYVEVLMGDDIIKYNEAGVLEFSEK